MKICLISNLYPPYVIGGAEIIVENVAKKLINEGSNVFVITTSPDKKHVKEKDGIKVYRINPLNLYSVYSHQEKSALAKPLWHLVDIWNPDSYFAVKKILKNEKPDIVHIHNFKGLSISVFRAAKDLKIPVVFTAHDCSLICPRANLLKGNNEACIDPKKLCSYYTNLNKNFIDNTVDWFIAPSNFLIDKLKSFGFFKNVKTTKIPLGVEMGSKKSEKTYDIVDISYMGNLNKNKGVHILIKAFKKLKNREIRLNIYGKGIDEEEFKKIADNDSRIIFHGFVSGEKLLNSYMQANIVVLPSICYDNSPMMIYESLMNGTPVIGSKIGGIPELIEEGRNGFLFDPGNEKELEMILTDLIENPSKLKYLEKEAFDSAKEFSMKNHIAKLTEIYNSLILEK